MIVITGASDGLGMELAKLYATAGKTVINVSRKTCKYASHNFLHDLREGEGIIAAAKQITDLDEPLEALINCAGVISFQELGSITEDEIKRTMATNVKAPIMMVSSLIDRIKHDGTDIVNVASTIGTKGYADQAIYGASKWAVRGFSANLQVELKDYPCRVISFCPGGMKTKMFIKATGIDSTDDGGEWMSPSDVAECLKQLLDLPKNMEVSEIIINRKATK
ncbi:MAG: SDR family oxidoreductase [Patescibacteria group bacterium]